MLRIKNLTVDHGAIRALHGVSISIEKGQLAAVIGANGAGKTTLAGKLAAYLKSQSHTPLLVAADLQRPNAVDQLRIVGERAGVPVFAPEPGNGVGAPLQGAPDAVNHAEVHPNHNVIVENPGRHAHHANARGERQRLAVGDDGGGGIALTDQRHLAPRRQQSIDGWEMKSKIYHWASM